MESLSRLLWGSLSDPDVVAIVRRALGAGVVLDTWMNGEEEEYITDRAMRLIETSHEQLAEKALAEGGAPRRHRMPAPYVRAMFYELVFSSALFWAQQSKGRREVDEPEAAEAVRRLTAFMAAEANGTLAAEVLFFVVSAHEDLNAIAYYGRMLEDDFLLGSLHRPWSNVVLTAQLDVYLKIGLVERAYTADGDMLWVTRLGREVLDRLRAILEESGEFRWRAENQRWAIFGEMNYDRVVQSVFPTGEQATVRYLDHLDLSAGMQILEVGSGTGRATVDLGLSTRVGATGHVTALDPSRLLLDQLEAKCAAAHITNVTVVQGRAEDLPFPDRQFDAAVAVAALHFTEVDRAVAEMTRVTKPGGWVSAVCPPPEFDVRRIPMVALWFRPLSDMASRLGVSFSEHNGLPAGALEAAFRRHLTAVSREEVPTVVSAVDYQSFLNFMLRGAALFQNVLCRLPYQERWGILRRLEESGREIAAHTTPEEQMATYFGEAAFGRVP